MPLSASVDISLPAVPEDCRVRATAKMSMAGRAALFLDRDGVLIDDVGYLGSPVGVHLLPHAAETVAAFNAAGTPVVVVTNQSGVGRGFYDWDGFDAAQDELERRLALEGAHLDAVFACGADPERTAAHPWRKPAPGMILAAARRYGLDLSRSRMVGDRADDLAAASAAGLRGGLIVGSDAEEGRRARALVGDDFEVTLGPDLGAARPWIRSMAKDPTSC